MTSPAPTLRVLLLGSLVSAALLTGCGTSVTNGTAIPVGAAAPAGAPSGGGSAGKAPIDVCSFFTDAEVKKLIESAPRGRATKLDDGGTCMWEDPQNAFSLTVEVGQTDTAINGTLPEWDPSLGPERNLPNGMRDINGAVEFVCGGNRLCSVQVATNSGQHDVDAAVALVPKIRSKVGG
ncbi:DUF3558 family protein [Pseudonocardia sp. CA-107938]|uniref:DUF3558 family protein n=1 Tax=Pseudonocardia sp. CA-107938 TaxID=3240021 RepID=UPI003D8FD2D0